MGIFENSSLIDLFKLFFISMLPIVELRGGIPIGFAMNMPWYETYIVCVVGNMLPVPFIILFIRKIFEIMKKFEKTRKIVEVIENKAMKKAEKVQKFAMLGLLILVAIPLPGTGAWTGTLIAVLMNLRIKYAVPTIFFGVLISGILVTLATYGVSRVAQFVL